MGWNKEFIKRLKEEITMSYLRLGEIMSIIDKLAGDKLVKEEGK